jgi:Family of unknown function (DUF5723)
MALLKINFRKFLYAFSFLFFAKNIQAQNDLGLQFSKTLWQNNLVNAAYIPENKVNIALPSYYAGYYNTFGGFTVRNNQTQTNKVTNKDWVSFGQEISFLGLGFRLPNGGVVTLQQNLHIDAAFGNDGELFEVITKGNAPYIGKTIDITPETNGQIYNELGVGYAQKIGKLNVGGKIKRYNGWAAARSRDDAFLKLTTNEDAYQLNFDLDYRLEASENLSSALNDLESLPNFETIGTPNGILDLQKKSGGGFGLDLGASYDVSDKITVGAAVNNLGRIKWKGNVYTAKTKFDIIGVDIQQLLEDSTLSVNAPTLDTVFQKMNFTKTATSFSTSPLTNYNFFVNYKINNYLTVNGLLGRTARGNYFALNTTARLKNWLEAGLTYSVRNQSFANLGTNIALKLGPFQMYLIADNLLATQKPLQSSNANFRIGTNLVFGKK